MFQKLLVPFAAVFSISLISCGGGGRSMVTATFQPPLGPAQTTSSNIVSHTITDIQAKPDWTWCTQKRNGQVCAAGLGQAYSSMTANQRTPSLGGNSSVFYLAGSAPYSNALWWNTLNLSNSSTHFTYDLYFYMEDPSAPEALEFDVNQSYNGIRYTWGTECSFKNTGNWDIWDPKNEVWVTTSVPCKQVSANSWHHLVWQFEKAGGGVHYTGVQLDGNSWSVDKYFQPQQNWNTPESNVAFQMDGDYRQTSYKVWLDHVSLTTW